MLRIVGGIVAGIVVAFLGQILVDVVSNLIFPAGVTDPWNKAEVAAAFAARPPGAFALMMLGYFVAGAAGGYVAKIISRRTWPLWVPPALITLFALIIALSYPLPAWARLGIVIAPLLGALLARHLEPRAFAEEAPADETAADADL